MRTNFAPTSPTPKRSDLQHLAEQIRAIEHQSHPEIPSTLPEATLPAGMVQIGEPSGSSRGGHIAERVPTGWPQVDCILATNTSPGGLAIAAVHEWFGIADAHLPTRNPDHQKLTCESKSRSTEDRTQPLPATRYSLLPERSEERRARNEWGQSRGRILLPRCILAHLAWQAIAPQGGADKEERVAKSEPVATHLAQTVSQAVVWVGRRCWPHAQLLIRDSGRDHRLFQHSLWVDPASDAQHLWAIDLALRCPAVAAVIADGSRFDIAATRRLQLAARAGETLLVLARPLSDLTRTSVATTRWLVQTAVSNSPRPRWAIELIRCKDQALKSNGSIFLVEWSGAHSAVVISSDVVHRSGKKTVAQ